MKLLSADELLSATFSSLDLSTSGLLVGDEDEDWGGRGGEAGVSVGTVRPVELRRES